MCECCQNFVFTVTANNAVAAPSASPVELTVDRPLSELPANHCFELCIPRALLRNSNTSEVELSDGGTTLPLITRCTDPLRYDSLVDCARGVSCRCGYVKLRCNRRVAPEPGHVLVKTKLPATSYAAPVSTPVRAEDLAESEASPARAAARKAATA